MRFYAIHSRFAFIRRGWDGQWSVIEAECYISLQASVPNRARETRLLTVRHWIHYATSGS
ncbi:MAG: hypothetical protein NVSMB43_01650 [Pseudarthrobacter sp.]